MSKLKVGQLVPNFKGKDYLGNDLRLKDFKGKKVLLSFHVFASCPFCNLRVNETKIKQPQWSAEGLEIIHVFPSPGESIARFAGKDNPPFTIIADPEKKLYAMFGLKKSVLGMLAGFLKVGRLMQAFRVVGLFNSLKNNDAAMHQLPGDFLIDEEGVIRQAFYAKTTSDNLPLTTIDSFLSNRSVEYAQNMVYMN
jgi:thioredoxin-dependent peroxiredoxin